MELIGCDSIPFSILLNAIIALLGWMSAVAGGIARAEHR
jgi:hypothetical protein